MQNPINLAISGATPMCRDTSTARRGREGGRPPEPAAPLAAGLLPLVAECPASSQSTRPRGRGIVRRWGKARPICAAWEGAGVGKEQLHSQCWPGSRAELPLPLSTPASAVACRICHPAGRNVAFAGPLGPSCPRRSAAAGSPFPVLLLETKA